MESLEQENDKGLDLLADRVALLKAVCGCMHPLGWILVHSTPLHAYLYVYLTS